MEMLDKDVKPLVSVIMPVYNAEKFVVKAIESVIKQTYANWELIIVDDGSSDASNEKIINYVSEKIHLLHMAENSGAAYLPRKRAFESISGEWVLNLDADDFLDDTYIENLLKRALQTCSDICLGQMIVVDEITEEPQGISIPDEKFHFSDVIDGRVAFLNTVPYNRIGLNGSLAKREVWERAYKEHTLNVKPRVHDDETFFRIALLEAKKICFSKSNYYYRKNGASVTSHFDVRIFEFEDTLKEMQEYVNKRLGDETEEYRKTILYECRCLNDSVRLLFKDISSLELPEVREYISEFRRWHLRVQWNLIRYEVPCWKYTIYRNFQLLILIGVIKEHSFNSIICILQLCMRTFGRKLFNNKYYYWYIERKKRERAIAAQIEVNYKSRAIHTNKGNVFVLNLYEGAVFSGGLADRFRGIISTYYVCKQMGVEYRLKYTNPFPLTDFLEANAYDWSVKPEEISYDLEQISVVVLDTTQDSAYQHMKQKKYMGKKIKHISKQEHIYTNAGFAYDLNYSTLFHELFKPSRRLRASIDEQQKQIGSKYISVSCRFLDLLGDFNEPFGYGKILSAHDIDKLIDNLKKQISKLHTEYHDFKILVNSDSETFLAEMQLVEYVYVIPGKVVHIDNATNEEYEYEKYEKTFVDFFTIAEAEKIFLLKSEKMFLSGYPLAASKIYNKPYEIINL